jgi:hypothetical protein
MFPTAALDSKILLRLTCSSIPQQQQINPQLILISCFMFFIIAIFLTLSFIWIQSYHRQKPFTNNLASKIPKDLSICSSRSYETISSGIYLESINTSATTLSTNPNSIIHHQISSPPLYHEILLC